MEILNLLVSLFVYLSCTELKRTLIKCSIGILIVLAILNLIVGIVVYSQSGGKKENFEAMTANEQLRFDSNVDTYTVSWTDSEILQHQHDPHRPLHDHRARRLPDNGFPRLSSEQRFGRRRLQAKPRQETVLAAIHNQKIRFGESDELGLAKQR